MHVARPQRNRDTPIDRNVLGLFGYLNVLLLLSLAIFSYHYLKHNSPDTSEFLLDDVDENGKILRKLAANIDEKFKSNDNLMAEIKEKLVLIENDTGTIKQQLTDLSKEIAVMQSNLVSNSQSDIIVKNDIFKKFEGIGYKLRDMAKTFEENTFITAPLVKNNGVANDRDRL